MALLVLFAAYSLQVRHSPYMSTGERDAVVKKYKEKRLTSSKSGVKDVFTRMDMIKEHQAQAKVKLGTDQRRTVTATVAKHMYNYNTVESTLLGSAVFVCLAGRCSSVGVVSQSLAFLTRELWFSQVSCFSLGNSLVLRLLRNVKL
jgi:hypothetical protein